MAAGFNPHRSVQKFSLAMLVSFSRAAITRVISFQFRFDQAKIFFENTVD
jgi:hypothetical protein